MCVCVSTVWAWTMRGHGAAVEVLEVVCVNSILGGALAGLLSAGCCWPRRCQENGSTIGQLVPTTAHCSGAREVISIMTHIFTLTMRSNWMPALSAEARVRVVLVVVLVVRCVQGKSMRVWWW